MRKIFSKSIYPVAIIVYSFFTLPYLLPNVKVPMPTSLNQKDVAIVLGGGVNPDCTLGESVQSRINIAIELYREGKIKKIMFSGGPQPNTANCVEAISMKRYARWFGKIPRKDLILENLALNTYQNAFFGIDLLEKEGFQSAYVVTSKFHAKRANFIFKQYGIDYQIIPSEDASYGLDKYLSLTREQAILCFHSIFGIPDGFGLNVKHKERNLSLMVKNLSDSIYSKIKDVTNPKPEPPSADPLLKKV